MSLLVDHAKSNGVRTALLQMIESIGRLIFPSKMLCLEEKFDCHFMRWYSGSQIFLCKNWAEKFDKWCSDATKVITALSGPVFAAIGAYYGITTLCEKWGLEKDKITAERKRFTS